MNNLKNHLVRFILQLRDEGILISVKDNKKVLELLKNIEQQAD